MKNTEFRTFKLILCSVFLAFTTGNVFAAGGHSGGHDDDHSDPAGGHAHDSWTEAPERFEAYEGDHVWRDDEAAEAGKPLYQAYCASCHGAEGQGDGPVADSLAHSPADLTNHFHKADGSEDSYLFWRTTKGGTVEPFKSQNSAMPAFEDVLSEQQRWEVLAYVHQHMHEGFSDNQQNQMKGMKTDSHGDDHSDEHQDDNH